MTVIASLVIRLRYFMHRGSHANRKPQTANRNNSPLLALFALALSLPVAAQAQNSAGISGTVADDDGKAVAAVFVVAYRVQPLPSVASQSSTGVGGRFSITGLPAGVYTLCVQAPAGGYLDPCHWSLKPPQVILSAGQASAGNALRVRKGSVLKVRVNDPGGLLQTTGRTGVPRQVVMGVWSPTTPFFPARPVGGDAMGMNYEVTIPFDLPVRFSMTSAHVRFADATAIPVGASGFSEVVQHRTGEVAPKSYTFTVNSALP